MTLPDCRQDLYLLALCWWHFGTFQAMRSDSCLAHSQAQCFHGYSSDSESDFESESEAESDGGSGSGCDSECDF